MNTVISNLTESADIQFADYVLLVDSSSLTTYKSTVTSLNSWWADSGSALSSSYSLSSSMMDTSSVNYGGRYSISASHLVYPNVSTSSYADSSSYALMMISASFARSASVTNSSSFASNVISSSYAKSSSYTISGSFAESSSVNVTTASFAVTSSLSNLSLTTSFFSASGGNTNASFVFPVGSIIPCPSSSVPLGWLKCDGSVYDTSSYVNLKTVIEDRYGPPFILYAVQKPLLSGNSVAFNLISGSGVYKIKKNTAAPIYSMPVTFSAIGVVGSVGFTLYDYVTTYTSSITVSQAISGPATESQITVTASTQYLLPNFTTYQNYYITKKTIEPLIYIIKY